jgi:hypothetical protein
MDTYDNNRITAPISSFKLRGREIDAILNDPPHWFVRVGGYIMLGLIVIIIGLCLLVRYPDTIRVPIVIVHNTTEQVVNVSYSKAASEITPGVEVLIEIDNKPHQKYGYIRGRITQFKYSAKTGSFRATVTMLPVRYDAKGVAIIHTKEKNLLQRLYSTLSHKIN